MVVDPDGPSCPCGRRGCWERFVGSGLRCCTMLAGRLQPGATAGRVSTSGAANGDPESLVVIDTFAHWVALGLVNLTNLLDPEMFVLGGGLATAPDMYLPPIERGSRPAVLASDLRPARAGVRPAR